MKGNMQYYIMYTAVPMFIERTVRGVEATGNVLLAGAVVVGGIAVVGWVGLKIWSWKLSHEMREARKPIVLR